MRRLRVLGVRLSGPLTALGRTVLVCAVVAWAVGVRLGWKELLVVAGAGLAALVLAVVFTIGKTELRVETVLNPPRVVAGDRAVAGFTATNLGRRMLPVRVELPIGRDIAAIDVPSLPAGGTFDETIVIPTSRRSVIAVGPTRSVRGDPLGLMRREVRWTDELELFVHPVTTKMKGVSAGWLRDLEGRPTNDRSQSDVAFHTLREYVPGDDRRHVHWRTSARLDKLMVRQYIDNRRSHLGIVLDTNPADFADAEEFELAVSVAASLGVKALIDGEETSCVAGRGIGAETGQSLLDGLARVELGVPTIDIQQAAMRAAPMMKGASVVAIVTGSTLPVGQVHLAGQRFGPEPAIVSVRAAIGLTASVVRSRGLLSLTAGSLDAFTRVMWSIGNS